MPMTNHIRACLDLIEQGHFGEAQGMRDHFIANDQFAVLIMSMVYKLRDRENWSFIDRFMGGEYLGRWLDFTQAHSHRAMAGTR